MLPPDWRELLGGFDAIYFGAVGWPEVVPDHVSLWGSLLQFRRGFDQYVNLRPVRLLRGVRSPLRDREPGDIDFLVVRENTEGEYSSIGGRIFEGTDRETVLQETVMTRIGVDRVLRYAFELAASRPARAPDVGDEEQRHLHLHALLGRARRAAMARAVPGRPRRTRTTSTSSPRKFVLQPPTGTTSSSPATSSATSSPTWARPAPARSASPRAPTSTRTARFPSLFEPVHGSAPDIAGQGIANPVGQIWSGAHDARPPGRARRPPRHIVAAIESCSTSSPRC